MADRVTQKGEIRPDWREGVRDPPKHHARPALRLRALYQAMFLGWFRVTNQQGVCSWCFRVNIPSHMSGRTLLAWRSLMVMRRFMPGDIMPLYVTIRQGWGGTDGRTNMTSEERKENRYKRRRQRRDEQKRRRLEGHDDFHTVFSYENLYKAYKCCRRGVSWKASVQRYISNAPLYLYQTWQRLMSGKYRSPGFFEFDLFERGKRRHIRSTVIGERVVQRCLCDNALVPALMPTMIYDNGASMKYKGYDFCMRRITRHLQAHYRKYGQEGYILLYDFSKFFDRVSHAVVKGILEKTFTDERVKQLTDHFIDAFGPVGLGLGSQISQVLALASANRLDHFIKEVLRIRAYGRYMDDGYLIHPSKAYLQKCLESIFAVCDQLHITLNRKKTQLVKLSHGFTWLQSRIFLTPTGKVVRKICKKSICRARRRFKTMKKRLDRGEIVFRDIWNSWQSWSGYARKFNAWHTIQNLGKLYNQLFIFGEW